MIGRPVTRFLTPESVPFFLQAFPRFKETGRLAEIEMELLRKDGTTLPVMVSAAAVYDRDGRFVASRATLFDISERVKAERRLRFQSQLLDVVGRAVIATDPEGRITYWNRAAEELYGGTAAEALGRSVCEKVVDEASQALAAEIMDALHAGQRWSGEFVVRRRDGAPFWAQVTDTPIHDAGGRMIGMIGVSMDISARKEAEQTLRLANIEMERTLRLRDEFLANMSHELRTPLAAILGFSEGLATRDAGPLNEKQQQYVAAIAEGGAHLLELINSILDLARIGAGKTELKPGRVDADAVAQAAVSHGAAACPEEEPADQPRRGPGAGRG
jgi:PAS domain S-box-containing protein